MPNIPVENCCGCTACSQICPEKAIQMLADEEGFLYPVVEEKKCISCGACENVCPLLESPQVSLKYMGCFVAQNTRDEVLRTSTSGGFVDALYRHVLAEYDGYAVGVKFDSDFMPVHSIANKDEDVKQFRGSKYAQSNMDGIFGRIKALLLRGEHVVFVGTPCQVAGLKKFLHTDHTGLITVDLVCRSVPSPKLWRMYLDWQEKRFHQKIKKVSCRAKTYGYHSGTLEIEFTGGKKYSGSNRVDFFMKSFHHDICSRPSCYQCPFKTKHRCSDFTVFDSWKPENVARELLHDDGRGFSNILVHTEKGMEFLRDISDLKLVEADPEEMFKYTGGMESRSILCRTERKSFYKDLNCIGFRKTMDKYTHVSAIDHLIEKLKPLVYAGKKNI